MSFFKNLFNRPKATTTTTIQCPRCLGKGHVDLSDIKRLGKEFIWAPGKCAYCNGTGKVDPDMVSKEAVNASYLTINLPKSERKKLINGDSAAIERMRVFDSNVERVTGEIIELYFVKNLAAEEIAELYAKASEEDGHKKNIREKKEMLAFINHVIAQKK